MRIKPFTALRPPPEFAPRVACVPYDTVDVAEARALAADNPMSFLRVVRAELELPDDCYPYSDPVYQRAADNFAKFIQDGWLTREQAPCFYVYELKMGHHAQYGVAGCCHAADYAAGSIKKHEKTRPEKVQDRAQHITELRAHTEPILLAYKDDQEIDALVRSAIADKPLMDFTAPDRVVHRLWRLAPEKGVAVLFEKVPAFYIADGHHRAAAAARTAAELAAQERSPGGDEEYNWMLGVFFPASQLRVLPYNRAVADLNGLGTRSFLAALKRCCMVLEDAEPEPRAAHTASMYLAGRWYTLKWQVPRKCDLVLALDTTFLQNNVLGPILGITDPRTSDRIRFISGRRGPSDLARMVDSGQAAVAFSMRPVTVETIMAVADAGTVMPPKSTWFEPKPRSGLFVHTF